MKGQGWFSGEWGLEREVLRVSPLGNLAETPHPFPPEEGAITVDFAEAQTELITGVHSTPLAALEELESLQDRLEDSIPHELLWPLSLPGVWEGEKSAPPARFAGDPAWEDQREYRRSLMARYGSARQVISGIHVNYSFGPDHPGGDYFSLARNFLRYRPILSYLLAGSPLLDSDFGEALLTGRTEKEGKKSRTCAPWTASIRQGPLGYSMTEELERALDIRYDSLEEYLAKLKQALTPKNGNPALLSHEREFYSPVRPKGATTEKGKTLEALAKNGVQYLEFRIFDLDPLAPLGMKIDTLRFFELFVIACTALPSPHLQQADLTRLRELESNLAQCSRKKDSTPPAAVLDLWKTLAPVLEDLARLGGSDHLEAFESFQSILRGKRPRKIDWVAEFWKEKSPLEWGLSRARLHKHWKKLELSTRLVIEEADRRGIQVDLLDENDNFIALEKDGRREYVKQATRTSADSYISALIMENKHVTKLLLERQGLKVPSGGSFTQKELALQSRPSFVGKQVVIKPNSTNFGDGVTLLEADAAPELWHEALETALSMDTQVLIEEFAPGLEFRFLVIGGQTRAVLHRIPTNVVGDGRSSIGELVEIKNRHPWRGENYKKPLEKIRLEAVELDFLAAQGLSPEAVPAEGQIVFLRKNSNISTGGDSIDYTDVMPDVYKRIAEKAVQIVGAQICGLDLILPDWQNDSPNADYKILELNFNPALHIHDFPAQGKNRRVEGFVLDLLGWK